MPQLGVGLWAGVIADWYNRRTILLVAKVGAATVNFTLALLILSGQVELWHVYATTVVKGVFMALDQPARQSLIPSIVPADQITNAVALNSATMNVMRIGGAAGAGLLLAVVGMGWTFMTIAVIFLGAVYFTTRLQVPPQASVENKSARRAASSFKEGIQYAWATPSIRWIVVLSMVVFGFGMPYMQVFAPLLAKQVLELSEGTFGLLMSMTGVGALVGALTLATINPRRNRGFALIGVMLAFGTMLILFSMSTYFAPIVLSFAFVAMVGMFQTPYHALANSVLLDAAPAEMRGRVMALLSLDRSVTMVGGFMAGLTSAALGVQVAQIIFGALCVLGALTLAVFVPALRRVQ